MNTDKVRCIELNTKYSMWFGDMIDGHLSTIETIHFQKDGVLCKTWNDKLVTISYEDFKSNGFYIDPELTIEEKIELTKNLILKMFPNCEYTIKILLWTDGTNLVECRHGDGDKIHIVQYHQNKLTYEKIDCPKNGIMMDSYGNEYYPIK